jgi:RimJ/RimL family protein N-acetyltransferase
MPETTPSRKETVLVDGKVSLRPYRPEDAADLYEAVRESLPELSAWMAWAHRDYSIKESRAWIKPKPEQWKRGLEYDFAIWDAAEGTYMGGCGLNRIDDVNRMANLGYWVRSGRTGHGAATAATLLLARWGFEKLGLQRIEIMAAIDNIPSRRVAEKVGARVEGFLRNRLTLNGRLHDAVMHSLVPGDPAVPQPPAPPPEE